MDKILVVLHNAAIDEARNFGTRLAKELRADDLLNRNGAEAPTICISAGCAQADEDSLIKDVLAEAESKDNLYYKTELK